MKTPDLTPADLQRLADALWQRPRWTRADVDLGQKLNEAGFSPNVPRPE
jgi:hypothetical protein